MSDISSSTAESSLLLWTLAAIVGLLASQVCLGWLQRAQGALRLRDNWRDLLVAAATLGTGIAATTVLLLSGEALSFPVGYHALAAPLLWLGAVAGCLPVVALLAFRQRWWALLLAGLMLAVVAGGSHVGWIVAAGFRPGVQWKEDLLSGAAVTLVVGFICGLWTAFGGVGHEVERRPMWRLVAAVIFAFTLFAGQEVVIAAAGVLGQLGSVYLHQVPGSALSLFCGVLVPVVLALMSVDLAMRQRRRRRGAGSTVPHRRRRRRHRYRSL